MIKTLKINSNYLKGGSWDVFLYCRLLPEGDHDALVWLLRSSCCPQPSTHYWVEFVSIFNSCYKSRPACIWIDCLYHKTLAVCEIHHKLPLVLLVGLPGPSSAGLEVLAAWVFLFRGHNVRVLVELRDVIGPLTLTENFSDSARPSSAQLSFWMSDKTCIW